VNSVPLICVGSLVAAEAELESVTETVIEVRIKKIEGGIRLLDRELVCEGLGDLPFEVDAGAWVKDTAAGIQLIPIRIDLASSCCIARTPNVNSSSWVIQ